jgi:predicted molibdopterin-dependent oxidoreductase YjgC
MIGDAYHAFDGNVLRCAASAGTLGGRRTTDLGGESMHATKKPKGRLTTPYIRVDGELRPASWDEALDAAAAGLAPARDLDTSKSFGVFSCSKASNEMNYLAQKFTRQVMGSNNIDSCNRT